MPIQKITLKPGEEFVQTIEMARVDEDGDIAAIEPGASVSLSGLLSALKAEKKMKMGSIEINFDFDSDGNIVCIEIYQ